MATAGRAGVTDVVKARATVGEVMAADEDEHGSYSEPGGP
jgi:hypothetical protein